MNELERFKKLKELGYVYEPDTGLVKKNNKVRGSKDKDGYIILGIGIEKRYWVKAHRFAWWFVYNDIPDVIDHINRVEEDNRLENLRNITKQKNHFNTKAKGFTYHKKTKKYQAQITIDQKKKYLGLYNTAEEARESYLEAKKIYHKI